VVHGLYTGKERPTTGVEFALCSLHDFATSVGGDRTAIRRDNVRLMLWVGHTTIRVSCHVSPACACACACAVVRVCGGACH